MQCNADYSREYTAPEPTGMARISDVLLVFCVSVVSIVMLYVNRVRYAQRFPFLSPPLFAFTCFVSWLLPCCMMRRFAFGLLFLFRIWYLVLRNCPPPPLRSHTLFGLFS